MSFSKANVSNKKNDCIVNLLLQNGVRKTSHYYKIVRYTKTTY